MAHITHYRRYSKNTQLTPGRTRVALMQLVELAVAMRLDALAEVAREGVSLAEKLIGLIIRRRAQRTARGGGDAQAIDRKLDKLVRALYRRLEDLADSLADEPLGVRASELIAAYFPDGYYAITSLPYEDELGAVTSIHRAFTEGDAADAVAPLELSMLVARIGDLLPAYAEALELRELVTAGDVRSVRDQMHVASCAAVAFVLFQFRMPDDESVRGKLLAPFDDQYARAAEARKRRASGAPVAEGEDGVAFDEQAFDEALADDLDDAALDEQERLDEAVAGQGPAVEAPGGPAVQPLNRG